MLNIMTGVQSSQIILPLVVSSTSQLLISIPPCFTCHVLFDTSAVTSK